MASMHACVSRQDASSFPAHTHTHNTSVLSSPCRIAFIHPHPKLLCAQRSGEQASRTRRLARHLLGCVGNQVFGERLPRLLLGGHLFPRICGSSSFWWPFVGLHYEHLPASTVVCYFKQHTILTTANGAASAFGTGPSSGYNPK